MKTQEYTSKTLDHFGLAAEFYGKIGMSDLTDEYRPSDSTEQIMSTGNAL